MVRTIHSTILYNFSPDLEKCIYFHPTGRAPEFFPWKIGILIHLVQWLYSAFSHFPQYEMYLHSLVSSQYFPSADYQKKGSRGASSKKDHFRHCLILQFLRKFVESIAIVYFSFSKIPPPLPRIWKKTAELQYQSREGSEETLKKISLGQTQYLARKNVFGYCYFGEVFLNPRKFGYLLPTCSIWVADVKYSCS